MTKPASTKATRRPRVWKSQHLTIGFNKPEHIARYQTGLWIFENSHVVGDEPYLSAKEARQIAAHLNRCAEYLESKGFL